MRYSQLFGKTVREAPKDAKLISHQLLNRGGFIKESTAGRYYFLPLGWRVHEKIRTVIKEEMNKTGAQEMLSPVLHPLELWEETNRTTSASFELMRVKDRTGGNFALGGTAEEMFVDLVRKTRLSYKDLPFHIYQFSTKFRDEMRARGGLLRVKEFIMKDGYSFDRDEESFKKTYKIMWNTYKKIFDRLGLTTVVIESDNGYIGGEYCHEFVVPSEVGESKYLTTEDGSYAAHEEVAKFKRDSKNIDETEKELQEVNADRGTTMEDGVTFHKLPLWQQIKDVLFVDEKGRFILSILRGDFEVNEIKLLHAVNSFHLRHATDEEIRGKLHSEPGFISPVGIKDKADKTIELLIVADISLTTIKNAYGGSNKKNKDILNMNLGRDYSSDITADIALAKAGYMTEDGKHLLIDGRGIEVGNIFQLGYHYTHLMKGANFIDQDGKEKPYYMGCYGIGLGRTMAAMVEVFHDEKGITWPKIVAPYDVHLISLNSNEKADTVYEELTKAGIEVLYDDREDVSAGIKFSDYELIGIPIRLIVSGKTGDKIEYKERIKSEMKLFSLPEVLSQFQ